MILRLCFIIIIFLPTYSYANSSSWNVANNYKENMNNPNVKIYLFASGASYMAANAYLKQQGMPKMFCQPRKLTLTHTNYIEIFEDKLKTIKNALAKPNAPSVTLEYVLLKGLISTFPCQ